MELQSRIFEQDEFQTQLDSFVDFLVKEGIEQVSVVFGFAWGNELGDGQWNPEVTESIRLLDRIHEVEALGIGKFGDDEIIIGFLDGSLTVVFCHERDIHLRFNQATMLVEKVKALLFETGK